MGIKFTPSSKLLFIGDSITDADWRKCPENIGKGFVRIVRDYLAAKDPASAPTVMNRGISGNKITDLQKRWQRDVIDLQPDVLNIYIGINDVWHGFVPDRVGCPIDQYVAGYRDILTQARRANPKLQLTLCEPSVIWLTDPPDANDRLKPYAAAVHELGREFDADCVVRLHEAFNKAREKRPEIAWTTDGVHPSSYGHMLIAREWLAATQTL
jgi:lysophospholipase L1-like esterase